MKTLVHAQILPGTFCRQPRRRRLSAAVPSKARHAFMHLRVAWRRYRPSPRHRHEDIGLLDRQVLEEIGLTREQVRPDVWQPVWWR